MMRSKFFFVVIIACGLAGSAAPSVACETEARKEVLDNGMTVLVCEMPASSVVSIDALVKTGSATEEEYMGRGISHFVEHMLFKGTGRRAVGQISDEVRAMGGVINASTGHDQTIYTIDAPKGTFGQAMDIIADMLMNSTFDEAEVKKERDVIFGEMRLYDDNPDRQLSKFVFFSVYLRHPYRHPVIGHEPLFAALTRDDLLNYYRTRYVPNNMILSVAGPVRSSEIFPLIKETFKDFAPRAYRPRNLPQEPPQIGPRRVEHGYPTELTRMSLAYQGVSVLNKDMYALDVLSMILGQGESSRLYREIVKNKNLVHAIDASNYTPMDTGVFSVDCIFQGENTGAVIDAVKTQIALVRKKGVTGSELEQAKRQVLSDYIFSNQTSSAVSHIMAINEYFVGDFRFDQQYVEQIKRVINADIKRVAARYLTDDNLTVVILKPAAEGESTPVSEDGAAKDVLIQKIVLDNGLTVLLREDHRFPLVAIQLAVHGGTGEEQEANNGISELTSRVWLKGTRRRSAEEIARSVESRGGRLSGFSGRQSLGLSFDLLSEDMDFGIELLADLVQNPVFPKDEIHREKEQLKAAILARQDRIAAVTMKLLGTTLFTTNSFRLDPLGSMESVAAIERDDIVGFYRKFTVPNHMVLSVFGDVEASQTLPLIKKYFSVLNKQDLHLVADNELPLAEMVKKTIHLDKSQAMVVLGFQGPRLSDQDRYGVEVLASILGESMSGRIFNRIREELGKAYTLGGGFRPGLATGQIAFYVLTTDEHVGKVKELLLTQVTELRETFVTDKELADTKAYIKGTHLMGLETNASLGLTCALDELYGLGFDNYQQHNSVIDRVTKEDVRALARKYLDLQHAAVIITRPPPEAGDGTVKSVPAMEQNEL